MNNSTILCLSWSAGLTDETSLEKICYMVCHNPEVKLIDSECGYMRCDGDKHLQMCELNMSTFQTCEGIAFHAFPLFNPRGKKETKEEARVRAKVESYMKSIHLAPLPESMARVLMEIQEQVGGSVTLLSPLVLEVRDTKISKDTEVHVRLNLYCK